MAHIGRTTLVALLGIVAIVGASAAGDPPPDDSRGCCSCTCADTGGASQPATGEAQVIACASQLFESGPLEEFGAKCEEACAKRGLGGMTLCAAITATTDPDPGLCGGGDFADCPTSEQGLCTDAWNNDAWLDNDTDCTDTDCREDPACRRAAAPAMSPTAALGLAALLGLGGMWTFTDAAQRRKRLKARGS